ncbi:cyclic pyranopterin monophosphate synthase MoaC [Candidatus Bathyarchaeota archaeon]|nr:MAG: cyclic pyranopterin monophosphate synthase MoaC [Candidatus Bathyarchaeota archaeon]
MGERGGEVNPLDMVDVSEKRVVHRTAEAAGRILLRKETLEAIRKGTIKKGDPFPVAEVAGILAAKRVSELIPLCHPIPLTKVDVSFRIGEDHVEARCRVVADYKTGVEMEALTGVTVALLTLWDMVKYLEKDEEGQYPTTRITEVRVVEKRKE